MKYLLTLLMLLISSNVLAEGFDVGDLLDEEAKDPMSTNPVYPIYLKGVADGIFAIDNFINKKEERIYCFKGKMPNGVELYSLVRSEIIILKNKMPEDNLRQIPLAFVAKIGIDKTYTCEQ